MTRSASIALFTLVSSAVHAASLDYEGSWNNTTFGTSGAAYANVTTTLPAVQVTLDLDGSVFGGLDPSALVLNGVVSPDSSIAFTAVVGHPTYGDVAASVNALRILNATATSLPNPGIASVAIGGQTSPTAMDLQYTVTFVTGGQALGTINMNLAPNPQHCHPSPPACDASSTLSGAIQPTRTMQIELAPGQAPCRSDVTTLLAFGSRQKLNWSMLSFVKTTGGPVMTTLFSPSVRSPSVPAVSFAPGLGSRVPLASCAAIWPAR